MRKRDLIRKNLVENAHFEKEIMCSANNPFIVRSYYSFTSKDNLYIVMEYISGGDAASLLRNLGALDEDAARQYIAETILVRPGLLLRWPLCSACVCCHPGPDKPPMLYSQPL
jgi:microtubule-associated serine/threonine kinase